MVVLVLAHAQYPCYTRDLTTDSPSFGGNLHCQPRRVPLLDGHLYVCVPVDCPIKKQVAEKAIKPR